MIGRWSARAGFSLADQATVTAAGLGLQVVLGRLLPPSQYGAFAVTYTVLLLVLGAHTSLVSEPMTILASTRTGADRDRLVGAFLRWHHRLVAGATAVAAIAAVVLALTGSSLTAAALGLAVALPGFLLFHLLRRIAYLYLEASRALLLSLAFAALLACGLAILAYHGWISPLTAWVALGAATGLSALWRLARRRPVRPPPDWRQPAAEAWSYGRWILAANLAHWLGLGLYVPAVGLLLGLDDAGTFRALQNLVAPVQQGLAAAGLLALPWLAGRSRSSGGAGSGLARLAALTVPPSLLYAALLAFFGSSWVSFLYDRQEYTQASRLLVLFAASVVVMPLTHCLAIAVRATDRPRLVFWSKAAAAAATLGGGLPMVHFLGLTGGVLGLLLSQVVETVVLAVTFRRSASG